MLGLVPPVLLLLFGAWCGTFAGSASFAGSTVGAAVLLGTVAAFGAAQRDALGLGAVGRFLPAALWIAAALSAWQSPVPRASWMALLFLPAFLLLPGAIARCWSRQRDRRLGLRALTGVTLGISLWALIDHAVRDLPRVATPLGQHNLLAAWLVILLPLSLLASREPGLWRWLGLSSAFLAAATILATKSLAGNVALAVEAVAALIWLGRSRRSWWVALIVVTAGVGLALQHARIADVLAGRDLSFQGRAVYWEGAWEGFLARPLLGWGPGSAGWTAAAFFDPVAGATPWGESIFELHSLPLHLAYELGMLGLAVAFVLVIAFLARRMSELRRADDPALVFAGLCGLLGAAVVSLGSAALAVTALPVAAGVAAGAALTARSADAPGVRRFPVLLYVAGALAGLLPLQAARWSYEQAIRAAVASQTRGARAALERAARLDPRFPLYRMRLALLHGPTARERAAAAELALRAARDARGVATLWTVAGILGSTAGRPWAREALGTACALDPFDPFPPFYGMVVAPESAEAPRLGAQALLAEPRLAAATFWDSHPDLLLRTASTLETWPGVDSGWKQAMIAAIPSPSQRQGHPEHPEHPENTARLHLEIDAVPHLSLSLYAFRRLPFPAQWPLVRVRMAPLERLRLPPATALSGTPSTMTCPLRVRSSFGQAMPIR